MKLYIIQIIHKVKLELQELIVHLKIFMIMNLYCKIEDSIFHSKWETFIFILRL